MSFESFIALRYLRSKKSSRTLSILSAVSLIGIFISVFSFFVIHSVMNGFSLHMKKALVGFQAHVRVASTHDSEKDASILQWIKGRKEVAEATPIVEFDGIIRTPDGDSAGAKMRGMAVGDIQNDRRIQITYFMDESLDSLTEGPLPGVIVGEDLYTRLKFFPGSTETISLIYPFGDVGPTGEVEPRRRDFRIIGILNTGFYEFDARYLLMGEKAAKELSDKNGPTDILVQLKPRFDAGHFKEALQGAYPSVVASTWEEKNRRLMKALKLERAGMFLLLSIVTFIASFNVFALMTILSLGKSRETALFYALGAGPVRLKRIFRRVGAFLGILGTAGGLGVGFLLLFYFSRYPLPLPPAYYLDHLPIQIDPKMVVLLLVMAPLFTIVASQLPAGRAAKVKPIAALRNSL